MADVRWLMFFNDHVVLIGKPLARFLEILAQHFLCQAYRISAFPATPAFELIVLEGEAGTVIIMKRTQAFMSRDLESQVALRPPQ